MSKANITPNILTWARKRAKIPVETLPFDYDKIKAWESGDKQPTIKQAQTLAKKLDIPFGYLFLNTPPEEELLLPDFRTVSESTIDDLSLEFRAVMYDTFRKQQWYKDYIHKQGKNPLPFIGKYKEEDTPTVIAEDIKTTIGIDISLRQSARGWEDFLRKLIRLLEEKGVLIFRSGVVQNNNNRKLEVEEFRGFAISDELAPVIFLNNRDAKAAQIFTLAHELSHLWIGVSGISNPHLREGRVTVENRIELLCNEVAAEVLVPQDNFSGKWDDSAPIADNIYNLVREYRVSSIVILRRAYDLNKISYSQFIEQYDIEISKQKDTENTSSNDGGNFYNTFASRHSRQLVRTVVSSALEGRTLYREAARLLGVKVSTIRSAYYRDEIW